jgi:hypothetical protein
MCGFTYITYSECAHTVLSTKPDHTSLCSHARLINLVQGVDCAPADCVPTDDTETRIAANYVIFDHCDDCRAVARAAKPIERGELDDILQLHAHAKEEDQGFYDEDETGQLRNLAAYLGEKHNIGLAIVEQLRTLTSNMSALALIADPELLDLLCAGDVDRHFTTFKYCSEHFPLMGSYIQQGAPNKLFVETFTYLRDKVKKATALLECFQIVVDCLLNHEPSQPEEHFNGSEARLEFFGDMLKHMITGRGLDIPPIAYHFHEDSFTIPEATIKQIEADQDVQQTRVEEHAKRSENTASRKERGVLNIHQLAFDPESLKGLLDDEPSRNFEAVHVAFPEDRNAMGKDVEYEQGNKLVWRDGNSYIILAVIEAKDKSATDESTEQFTRSTHDPQTVSTKITRQPKEGLGFNYSDDEDDTLVDAEVDETKDIARTPNTSNIAHSDPSPYLHMPSSPLITVAGVPLSSLQFSSSSPSSPSRPTRRENQKEAETIQTNSGSSSPSRKRKALPSGMDENGRSISSEDEEAGSENDHHGSPVKRKCTKSLSSSSSSSRSTTPVEAKVDPPSAPASPFADLPPLPSSSSSTDSSSLSSASPEAESVSLFQQPPAPLPPQPTPPRGRMQTHSMARSTSAAPAPPPTGQRRSPGK